jgi:hypothetical protein
VVFELEAEALVDGGEGLGALRVDADAVAPLGLFEGVGQALVPPAEYRAQLAAKFAQPAEPRLDLF